MNLDVTTGSLAGDTVALSRSAAATIGVSVGQTAQLHLGDGTVVTPGSSPSTTTASATATSPCRTPP